MRDRYDAIVVGGGAAGLSAALVLGRSRRRVLVCDDGHPRNAAATQLHGFLTRDGTPPMDFLRIARSELRSYPGVGILDGRVERASSDDTGFRVETHGGEVFAGRRLLLATGVADALPEIEGLNEFWGRSVFVCPYCDGWEFRDRRVAVLAKGRKSVELAQELHQWTRDVIVCADGDAAFTDGDRRWLRAAQTPVRSSPVRRLQGEGGAIEWVEFEDGTRERCEALFLSAPLRQSCRIAAMLGCRMSSDSSIAVDTKGRSSVERCYAAGDAVTSVHQVLLAAASGVCAALAINEDSLAEEVAAAIRRIP